MTTNAMNQPDNLPDNFVVAIDGPAGAGKSTMAKLLAKEVGGVYVDTGAMYRSVTACVLDNAITPSEEKAVSQVASNIRIEFERDGETQKTIVDGRDLTTRIREPDINKHVSTIAAYPAVRRMMVKQQREMGRYGRIIMEGRDIGTNVFPDADFKFFLTADDNVRADRRLKEMGGVGHTISKNSVLENIRERDEKDSGRAEAPLLKAEGAVAISTTDLTVDEVLQKMLERLVFGL